jgi:choloylglycine hydrolase
MCSGIKIICRDGTILVARTLEFAMLLDYEKHISNSIIGITSDGYFLDGINKYGLSVMAFYFPNYIQYSDSPVTNNINLSSLEFSGYLLNEAKSVYDVKNICEKITVINKIYKPMGIVVPLHWFCCDKKNNCVVIECVNGKPIVYDNNLGVMTNSPTYPEHIKSLQNYPDFSPYNIGTSENPRKNSTGLDVNYSQGTGFLGLPGDFSSISRFVRLNIFQKYHNQPENKKDGINTIFHILNNFDIVKGYVISPSNNKDKYEFTQYTVVYDLNNFETFYKSYNNQNIQKFQNKNNYMIIFSLVIFFLILIFIFCNK